jgi:hypothetical protein
MSATSDPANKTAMPTARTPFGGITISAGLEKSANANWTKSRRGAHAAACEESDSACKTTVARAR